MKFPNFNNSIFDDEALKKDYNRYASMALWINRMQQDKVPGCIAEVGVHKGFTSKFIEKLVPGKKIYLLDSFSGFPERYLEADQKTDSRFKDTSYLEVQKQFLNNPNVVIVKGIVPTSFELIGDNKYSFVLLDLDLFQPTLDSLKYFYPRMARGGFIVIHDYNSPESNWGCNRAVNEFFSDKPEFLIEIPDEWGSVVVRKL